MRIRLHWCVIRGDGSSQQEVAIAGHLFAHIAKQGALDDASGSAVALEAARAWMKLIHDGVLPRPGRTIRFLWIDEMQGTRAYLERYPEEVRRMVAVIAMDMVGEDAGKNRSSLHLFTLFTASTGSPVLLLAGTNVSGTGENEDRPDLVGDPFANVPVLTGTKAVQYFNPAAFAKPAAGSFGNLGRDAIYGPGFGSVDFSVFKRTPVTEKIGAEFRVEIFNLTNRTNWANPGASFSSGSFGQLSSTKGGKTPGLGYGEPRNIQLGLRSTF